MLDFVNQVCDVVLMSVYLDLGNPGGSGFWNEGYMTRGGKWEDQFTSNHVWDQDAWVYFLGPPSTVIANSTFALFRFQKFFVSLRFASFSFCFRFISFSFSLQMRKQAKNTFFASKRKIFRFISFRSENDGAPYSQPFRFSPVINSWPCPFDELDYRLERINNAAHRQLDLDQWRGLESWHRTTSYQVLVAVIKPGKITVYRLLELKALGR